MAYLGLADEAQDYLVPRVKNYHGASRSPGFWSNPWSFTPCQDHGSIVVRSLQTMTIQHGPYSDKVYLLPAWPKNWDAQFKLHAPKQTTVEGRVEAGRLVGLTVTPASRMKDMILCGGFACDIKGLSVLQKSKRDCTCNFHFRAPKIIVFLELFLFLKDKGTDLFFW